MIPLIFRSGSGAIRRVKYSIIDSHTAGAPTRLLLGAPSIGGSNMMSKKQELMKKFDHLRTTLMQEPRGNNGVVAIPVKPTSPGTDLGLIFADYRGYVDMCIHGTIGVVTTLVECSLVSKRKIKSRVFAFDTPAGIVEAEFSMKGNKVCWVKLTNVPSFFLKKEKVSTKSFGDVKVSLAYGGNLYGYTEVSELGLKIRPEELNDLLKLGREILYGTRGLRIFHPLHPEVKHVLGVSLFQDIGKLKTRNIMIAENDLFDRSPCGTGTCGRMAVEYENGSLPIGEEFESKSIIGSMFFGRIIEYKQTGKANLIIPEIRGTAYLTARSDVIVDAEDPLARGFLVDESPLAR